MDKKEAQFILSAFRPNGKDAEDSRIAEAVRMAEADPALGAWFESEVRMDTVLAEKIGQAAPPDGLREEILAGMNMAETSTPWWRRAPLLAIAASVIVAFGLFLSWQRPTYDSEFDELRANAVSYAAGFVSLDFFDDHLANLAAWLTGRDAPATVDLAGSLESMPGIGCRTLNWSGKTVSLICLQGDTVYHVFMADRDDVDDPPDAGELRFWEMKRRTVVSWSDAERVYVLVTKASPEEVRSLL